ncbi:hypothetical protein HKD37_08G021911 [Glycine soja]
MGSSSARTWEWCLQWRRILFEAEIPMGACFLEEIQHLNINEQQQDRWVWLSDSTGVYTVSSAYQLLDRESRDENIDGVFQDVWKLKIPRKRMRRLPICSSAATKLCRSGGSVFTESKTALHAALIQQYLSLGIKSHRWLIWWVSLTWCVWNHRNKVVFSNDSFNANKLMEDAVFFCLTWLRNLEKGFDIFSLLVKQYQRRFLFVIRGN